MSHALQSPRLSTSSRRLRNHDTGFPEPFNGVSNTTLPHPEANISPDAVISQEDITVSRVSGRSRRSFRHKHKRTISHGRITPQMEAMYSEIPLEEDEDAMDPPMAPTDGLRSRSGSSAHHLGPTVMSVSTGRPSTSLKDGDSVFSHNGGGSSPTASEHSQPEKKGVLRKLRFLK